MALNTHGVICQTVGDPGGGDINLNLHDGDKYLLEYYYLGDPDVTETWIHPDAGGIGSYLARRVPRPVKMTIVIHVLPYSASTTGGASTEDELLANCEAVRNEFEDRENYIDIGMSASTAKRYHTWPSPITPATMPDDRSYQLAKATYRVLDWALEIWRDPTPDGIHMPVI